jgi:hypothetical protein
LSHGDDAFSKRRKHTVNLIGDACHSRQSAS